MRISDWSSDVCSSDLQHLTPLDLLLLRTPKKSTDVVTRLPLIQKLPEHLNTRARRLLRRPDPHDLDLITRVDHTLLHLPGENSAATSDREHILDRQDRKSTRLKSSH